MSCKSFLLQNSRSFGYSWNTKWPQKFFIMLSLEKIPASPIYQRHSLPKTSLVLRCGNSCVFTLKPQHLSKQYRWGTNGALTQGIFIIIGVHISDYYYQINFYLISYCTHSLSDRRSCTCLKQFLIPLQILIQNSRTPSGPCRIKFFAVAGYHRFAVGHL